MSFAAESAATTLAAGRPAIRLRGASENNLRNIDVAFPLGALTVVTGISGSGKSSLVCDTLYPATRRALGLPAAQCGSFRAIEGVEKISAVELVDQSPIGKSSRSTPASFVGAFDAIRAVFAASPAAKSRGFGIGDFSFNSGLGRCPACEGSGFEHIEMQFLSDVYLPCEECGGRRYRAETLEVKIPRSDKHGSLSIADALELTVEEAAAAFGGNPTVVSALQPLMEAGLGYLRLGQPVPTLSGGEAQRLKLAGFLASIAASTGTGGGKPALLLFDEPTTGLHFSDIASLLAVFRRLADAGHALVVVEHNLQVVRAADWIIDLGPGGGASGGDIVFAGRPVDLALSGSGATAAALRG
jgi:excinuclease ABC subunit A